MALPVTLLSAAGIAGHQPPCKSSGGSYYSIIRASGTAIDAYKATDPTSSFAVQDATANPAAFSALEILSYIQDGDEIHIVTYDGVLYEYHVFDMSSDTWTITDEVIETPADLPTYAWASIAVRSNSEVIVAYAGDTDQVMGGKKERVDFAVRSAGGVWTVGAALDAAGDIHYGNPNCAKGPLTDDIHFVWATTSNTTDPPVAWTDTNARTLAAGSTTTLSTLVTSTESPDGLLALSNIVTYDDAGTVRIVWAHRILVGNTQFMTSTEDGSGNISAPSTGQLFEEASRSNGEEPTVTLIEDSGNLHYLLASFPDDRDIYYTSSTDDAATWATGVEELDAVTCNRISANIYVRGTDTVLAYVYDDGGVQKYNEKVLSTAGPTTYNVSITETAASGESSTSTFTGFVDLTESGSAADSNVGNYSTASDITESGTSDSTQTSNVSKDVAIPESVTATDSETATADFVAGNTETATADESSASDYTTSTELTETAASAETSATALSSTASNTETATADESSVSGLLATADLTETSAVSETQTKTVTATRDVTEPATAVDSQDNTLIGVVDLTESVTVTESQASNYQTSSELTEAVTAIETQNGTFLVVREVTESVIASEAQTGIQAVGANVVENSAVSEVQTGGVEANRDTTETVTTGESSSNTLDAIAALTEPATATESSTGISGTAASLAESATASESQSTIYQTSSNLTEAANANDLVTNTADFVAAQSEAGNATESAQGFSGTDAALNEAVTASDLSSANANIISTVAEILSAADAITGGIAASVIEAVITEALTAEESQIVSAVHVTSASEALTATDSVDGSIVFLAATQEIANAIDSASSVAFIEFVTGNSHLVTASKRVFVLQSRPRQFKLSSK